MVLLDVPLGTISINRDGLVAVACEGKVIIMDLDSRQVTTVIHLHHAVRRGPISLLAFSPDGQYLAVGFESQQRICIWCKDISSHQFHSPLKNMRLSCLQNRLESITWLKHDHTLCVGTTSSGEILQDMD